MSIDEANALPASRRRPGRPTSLQAGRLRALCIDAALECFVTRGYEGTSIESIARVARASKMTLYRLYGTKEELFRIVVRDAIERARRRMELEFSALDAPRQALRALVAHLYDALTEPNWLAVQRLVIAEGARFPALLRELLAPERELMTPAEAFLRAATTRGALAVPDPRAAAYQLSALASGGVRFLLHEPLRDAARRRAWIDAITELAWASWRPHSGRRAFSADSSTTVRAPRRSVPRRRRRFRP